MKMLMSSTLAVAVAFAFAAAPAAAGDWGGQDKAENKYGKNIVETAAQAGQFETLLAAAKAAGLAETLSGDGPFTVFAPTDEAFANLPDGALEKLLADPDQLKRILLLHVVPGKVKAEAALKAGSANTAYGQPLAITVNDGQPMVNDAKIVKTDIAASNGVIHVIDKVMLPKSIVGVAASDDRFTTLVTAVKAAGLAETLSGEGPFTVFAPTNEAFAKLPAGTVQTLLKPENKAKLIDILTYHVVAGDVKAASVVELDQVTTLQGGALEVKVKTWGGKTKVTIGEATVVMTDINASNGVIHVIDTVLIPADETASAR